ncbi:tRNA (guanosine(46)-N7)-methyltransferase TrmB [Ferrovibrio sp.]|uniref:tRNA (guanosine(46)-N7)-methyltransferase TrmB n=1 Tax=Ferrovibrio sp. TaxID=1917215 RepID=UPI0025B8EBA1|nr:tRNA (guanosine(46)-N7)-methyltransferase TrmB [Ferrovibrio sp.]MBX3456074.1 tRNA (guanosine(46)-N7)-methyltransferase TrmB [Ferrovibrio sp.]
MSEPAASPPRRQIYGRRRGRKLTQKREDRMQQRLPELCFDLPPPPQTIDLQGVFGEAPERLWLEIGFGVGDHLFAQAQHNPDVHFLGVEPFLYGVSNLVDAIVDAEAAGDAGPLRHIRLLTDDARLLLKVLPDASLERAFILFPDPWPKKRHNWRRIVNADTLADLARCMKPGGELRLATDVPDYARWMLRFATSAPGFAWMAEKAADWRERPADWPSSKYERKARAAGRSCWYFRFRRL